MLESAFWNQGQPRGCMSVCMLHAERCACHSCSERTICLRESEAFVATQPPARLTPSLPCAPPPAQIRGVPVGGVLSVSPSLEKVDVLVEVRDSGTVIPRNSIIEANQSGLIAEPLIDITPQLPIPEYTGGAATRMGGWWAEGAIWGSPACFLGVWGAAAGRLHGGLCCCFCSGMPCTTTIMHASHGRQAAAPAAAIAGPAANPLDEECEKEGKVVCHQGRIRGERGE